VIGWVRRRIIGGTDAGTAIVEFVFVAVVVMVPLVYLIVAVAGVQRTQFAVSQAAREAGRAYATSDSAAEAPERARAAVHIAMHDQGLPDDADLAYVAAGAACTTAQITPSLQPGSEFTVCITRHVSMPAVPRVVAGKGITVVGKYVVHIDDYRTVS
jgi:Flp pilus assembly protein TadG